MEFDDAFVAEVEKLSISDKDSSTAVVGMLIQAAKRARIKVTGQDKSYTANGDMITKKGQVFRQVGWQINGGVRDGEVVTSQNSSDLQTLSVSHGGYSPVYIEVGD